MPSTRATLQHLQTLQAGRPLEIPPASLGATDPSIADLRPKELFVGCEAADDRGLRVILQKAEFWISLLEGEHSDLAEEVAKHKLRSQLALKKADAKGVELKEVEGEKKRLLSEIKWLQQSRDQAICDRALLREDATRQAGKSKDGAESAAAQTERIETLEAELERMREEKNQLVEQLVEVKMFKANTMQKVDSMECLIEYYEHQLRNYDPKFQPMDLSTMGQWMKPSKDDDADSDCSGTGEHESVVSREKPKAQQIAKGLSKMLKKGGLFKSSKKKDHKHDAQEQDEIQATPREHEDSWRHIKNFRNHVAPSPQLSASPRLSPSPRDRRGDSSLTATPASSTQARLQASPRTASVERSSLGTGLPPGASLAAVVIQRAVNESAASPMPPAVASTPEPESGNSSAATSPAASARPKKRWEIAMRRDD